MHIKITVLSLFLSTTTLFCSEKIKHLNPGWPKKYSLENLAFEQCKKNFEDPAIAIEILNNYLKAIPDKKQKDKVLNYLNKNKLPILIEKITSFENELYTNFTIDNSASQKKNPLEYYCKNSALANLYQRAKITPPLIQREDYYQQVNVQYIKDDFCVLRLLVTSISNYRNSSDGPTLHCQKKISFYDTQTLKVRNEITTHYDLKNQLSCPAECAYPKEPLYSDQESSPLKLWLENHKFYTHTTPFLKDSFVVTHVWGGIEIHKNDSIACFMAPHTIKAVSCSPDGKIAIGGHNGEITIFDTTQETEEKYATRYFVHFFSAQENLIQKNPLIIYKWQSQSSEAIGKVEFYNNGKNILFCSEKKLFFLSTSNSKKKYSHTCVFEAENIIKSFFYSNNTLVLILENNEIVRIDIKNSNDIPAFSNKKSVFHTSAINTICSYCSYDTEKDQLYLFTGDNDGNVIIWDINKGNLTTKITLPHDAPVQSVEISPDQNFFVVKTTNVSKDGIIKDDIFFYPTPAYLSEYTQEQFKRFYMLTDEYNKNKNNPTELYTLLCNNKFFFCSAIGQSLTNRISKKIVTNLKKDCFINSIESIDNLKQILDLFHQNPRKESTFITKQISLEVHNFVQLDSDIEKTLAEVTTKIIIREFEKAQNDRSKQQKVYNFANLYTDLTIKSSQELKKNLRKHLEPLTKTILEESRKEGEEKKRLQKIKADIALFNEMIPKITRTFEEHQNNLSELYKLYMTFKSYLSESTNPIAIELYQKIQDQLNVCLQNENSLNSIKSIKDLKEFLTPFAYTIRKLQSKLTDESFPNKQPLSCNTVGKFEQLLGCVVITVILEEFAKKPNDKNHQQIVFDCFTDLRPFARIVPPKLKNALKEKVRPLLSKDDLQKLFPEKSLPEKIISFATDNTTPLIIGAAATIGIAGYFSYLFLTNKK